MIDNKTAHEIVSIFNKLNCIVVGSYGRSSHEKEYKDLDFITIEPLNKIENELKKVVKDVKVTKNGLKYKSFLIDDKYHIDVWKTEKESFYKRYLQRTLDKTKLMYINKILTKY